MKIRLQIITISSLAACPFTPAVAIEPPPATATPPAALLRENKAKDPAPAIVDNTPFIGISTAEVPDIVASHLDLSDGSGVIIRTVCPDSPAEKAGLSTNDIIVSLDGKPIADPQAFSAAISDRKVGDRLEVDLIHKGKPAKVEVTLGARPADLITQLDADPFLEGIPKIHADRLRGLIEQNLGGFGAGPPGIFPDEQFEDTFRQMRKRMNRQFERNLEPNSGDAGGGISFQQNSTIRLMDGEGSVEISSSNDDTQVKVRGKDNKLVWSGSWNTDADKDAAPKDIRERIDRVNSGGGTGFSFRFGKLRSEPDTIDN